MCPFFFFFFQRLFLNFAFIPKVQYIDRYLLGKVGKVGKVGRYLGKVGR